MIYKKHLVYRMLNTLSNDFKIKEIGLILRMVFIYNNLICAAQETVEYFMSETSKLVVVSFPMKYCLT